MLIILTNAVHHIQRKTKKTPVTCSGVFSAKTIEILKWLMPYSILNSLFWLRCFNSCKKQITLESIHSRVIYYSSIYKQVEVSINHMPVFKVL